MIEKETSHSKHVVVSHLKFHGITRMLQRLWCKVTKGVESGERILSPQSGNRNYVILKTLALMEVGT